MKKLNRKIALAVVLTLCITLLAGTITARASISEDIGVCWWQKNKAHEGAEAARALGCTDEYVLRWFGNKWTEANNRQKELEASRREWQGVWTITAYANDGASASGMPLYAYPRDDENMPTVACNCLPFGTIIEIEGLGQFKVVDRGASSGQWAWHNSAWCDIYLWSNAECVQFGRQHRNVWVVK